MYHCIIVQFIQQFSPSRLQVCSIKSAQFSSGQGKDRRWKRQDGSSNSCRRHWMQRLTRQTFLLSTLPTRRLCSESLCANLLSKRRHFMCRSIQPTKDEWQPTTHVNESPARLRPRHTGVTSHSSATRQISRSSFPYPFFVSFSFYFAPAISSHKQ